MHIYMHIYMHMCVNARTKRREGVTVLDRGSRACNVIFINCLSYPGNLKFKVMFKFML